MNAEICFIGIGNEFRSDDAAGIAAVKKLEYLYSLKDNNAMAFFYYFQDDAVSIIPLLEQHKDIIIIDAVMSGNPPGTVHELDLNSHILSNSDMKFSGHLMNLFDAIRLAKELYDIHTKITFIGIEAEEFQHGIEMSAEVKNAVNAIAGRLGSDF